VRWWRLAAAQGDAGAQVNLGHMFSRGGDGVAQDKAEAGQLHVPPPKGTETLKK
jgi:TPR repeat protein